MSKRAVATKKSAHMWNVRVEPEGNPIGVIERAKTKYVPRYLTGKNEAPFKTLRSVSTLKEAKAVLFAEHNKRRFKMR